MNFVKTDLELAIDSITRDIQHYLDNGRVLLLLSGGSNIEPQIKILAALSHRERLTIGLIDERYGDVGHPDSNWQKLLDTGLPKENLALMPVLVGKTVEETSREYNKKLAEAFDSHETVIGIFGMGPDGHTSGILPHSQAVTSADLVTYYKGPDFMRITTTPISFGYFDIAYLIAYGAAKTEALHNLAKDISIADQPAQALKAIAQCTVFNDSSDGDTR